MGTELRTNTHNHSNGHIDTHTHGVTFGQKKKKKEADCFKHLGLMMVTKGQCYERPLQ